MKRLGIQFRRLWRFSLLAMGVLLVVVSVNVWRLESRQLKVAAVPVLDLPEQLMLDRFAGAIQIGTVSQQNPTRIDDEEFDRFRSFLESSFPSVHASLHRLSGEDFGDDRNRSLLFKWESANHDRDSILLMAHYDVVPVEPAALGRWTNPPFSGQLDDAYLWGRGTLDAKNSVMGLMEAIEHLIQQGFQPSRTVYLSLGHDEELGGTFGNKVISEWMRRQGIRLEFVLDEGGCIFTDFSGCERPVALVGVAEKGYLNMRLAVELKEGGHSSMPPASTAIGILAAALQQLEKSPFPKRLDGGADLTLDYVGPELPLAKRVVIGNRWLLGSVIQSQMAASPAGNASLRTTMAPTMLKGGVKENILPTKAEAVVNVRILPGDTVDRIVDHMKAAIGDDRVILQVQAPVKSPSRISSTDSEAFHLIQTTIQQIFPEVVVAPFVVVGGTDASHFDDDSLSKDVYRFLPSKLSAEDLPRIHGIDERISRRGYLDIVRFYVQLLKNVAGE